VIVILLLGAIVNVAVAWGCSTWSRFGDRQDLPYDAWCSLIRAEGKQPEDCRPLYAHKRTGFGLEAIDHGELCGDDRTMAVTPTFGLWGPFHYRAGWPLHCLAGEWFNNNPPVKALSTPALLKPARPLFLGNDRVLPLDSIWPGFAINTLFHAAILWLLFAGPGTVRRNRRIRRGLCPACAYPVGESNVCTECGVPVRPTRS
jgi:hypothetical protein